MAASSSSSVIGELTALAQDFEVKLDERIREVKRMEEKVSEDREALAAEKAAMHVVGNAHGSDVLQLNVGGRLFTTKRHTLTQVEGSVLAAMFSGRWENSFDMDDAGHVFLDLDPECFAEVLHQLRYLQLTNQSEVSWAKVIAPGGREAYFRAMLDFLGLAKLPAFSPVFSYLHPSIDRIGEDRCVLSSCEGHKWAIGEAVMEAGTYMWGVKIRTLKNNDWMFLGVIASTRPNDNSFSDATSYGWAGSGGQTFSGGVNTSGHGGWSGFHEGDDVTMQFNVDSGVLRMKVARLSSSVFHLTGLRQAQWRVHVNIYNMGDSVSLVSAVQF
mmetsp:Transcript_48051/g.134162  ORF Transcript_48051/g.134162 Transcript_48051/m.134162 type:complete len:328 (-) Transcript_48051:96-1079(-)|eukprot:CAMPEP_0117474614 /NCGR_PEP_ID=MMETSP0784-20121206/9374_1 /TAXON_ID=39447 /ORGANISM="" /LENGTH=327 /DNA_ID=CAMNT_0005268843 /DNA_START=162 /DNA_END=1145 /DNA_ORIENTATION=+